MKKLRDIVEFKDPPPKHIGKGPAGGPHHQAVYKVLEKNGYHHAGADHHPDDHKMDVENFEHHSGKRWASVYVPSKDHPDHKEFESHVGVEHWSEDDGPHYHPVMHGEHHELDKDLKDIYK